MIARSFDRECNEKYTSSKRVWDKTGQCTAVTRYVDLRLWTILSFMSDLMAYHAAVGIMPEILAKSRGEQNPKFGMHNNFRLLNRCSPYHKPIGYLPAICFAIPSSFNIVQGDRFSQHNIYFVSVAGFHF
jgi:hypothetical protein